MPLSFLQHHDPHRCDPEPQAAAKQTGFKEGGHQQPQPKGHQRHSQKLISSAHTNTPVPLISIFNNSEKSIGNTAGMCYNELRLPRPSQRKQTGQSTGQPKHHRRKRAQIPSGSSDSFRHRVPPHGRLVLRSPPPLSSSSHSDAPALSFP